MEKSKTKSYNEDVINELNKSIELDQFNDGKQNETSYSGGVSGEKELKQLFDLIPNNEVNKLLDVGSGGSELWSDVEESINLEPNESRANINCIIGWAENIQARKKSFDCLVCWGTLCFVRGLQETLYEFNRVLKIKGYLILDTVSYTTMPLAQTVHPESFVRYINMFGFELIAQKPFGWEGHERVGFVFRKYEDFDYRRMCMPQSTQEINNFLPKRDWYLK